MSDVHPPSHLFSPGKVQQIQASRSAFAAILMDGSVVCWGDPRDGGDCSLVQHQLVKVQQVQSTLSAFVPWYL